MDGIVSAFGAAAKAKLDNPAITGAPEDQLRGPLESLIRDLAALTSPGLNVTLVGETTLAGMQTRPDFAVSVNSALVGFIEVKAPGKGCDPRRFSDRHDKEQWAKLKALPNLLYTDGNGFTLWRDGELAGRPVAFEGDIERAGARLVAPPALGTLVADFLNWAPIPPRNAKRLAEVSARLCRLLRDEVKEQLALGNASLAHLKQDWRKLLFPEADDATFADGYAQAVTFGLLMAKAYDVDLSDGVGVAALHLRRSNTLIGTALNLLTEDEANQDALKTALGTMLRVFDGVDWHAISRDRPEAWLYFYEDFLEVYDNRLRKLTGSYYTPPEVVAAMTALVDEALRGPLFERPAGLAAADVTIADPAVGTGTFLLGALRRIAKTVAADQGEGAVAPAIAAAARRLYGFELQFGPFAVAQLRLLAEMQALTGADARRAGAAHVNLYVTDTLGNPFVEEERLTAGVEPIARSRREANRVKREEKITVVIGNPPYKEKAEGRGGWIEQGAGGKLVAALDRWKAPPEWGVGAHGKHLKNLYVYFWRWATLKVFGAGRFAATGLPDGDEEGVVCFITVAGFLNGPGFEKMRDDLRRSASEIFVVDCSPEGHQPEVATRIFQGVQHPVCIVLAARRKGASAKTPARVRFRALAKGRREEKFAELATITLDDAGWRTCSPDWRAPFLPAAQGLWAQCAPLAGLFDYNGSGVMPGRTWIIAPDAETLERRWDRLIREKDAARKEELFHPHEGGDKSVSKPSKKGLHGHEARLHSVAADKSAAIRPIRYGFRTLDRQWIVPDNRLINRPNPALWDNYSERQIFLTALQAHSPTSGPSVSFAHHVPDLDHFHGRGGRVYPLWRDAGATAPNLRAAFLQLLAEAHGVEASAEDAFAYVAGVMAHPGFTARFAADLTRPGLRLPLTADHALFAEAVAIGREIVWLHCHGERFVDAAAGRPKGPPRLPEAQRPRIPKAGAIPGAPAPLPDEMRYDAATGRLHIGAGFVENVTPAMAAYDISGKNVLTQWFSYRKRDRSRPLIGDRRPPSPLETIQPEHWLAEYTSDLIDLLNVLGRLAALEPRQADLLARICAAPLIDAARLAPAAAAAGEEEETVDEAPSEVAQPRRKR